MNYPWISSLALITMQVAFAEDHNSKAYIVETHNPHHIAIVSSPPPIAPQYEHKVGVGDGRILYERTKNEDVYFSTDVFATRFIARINHPHGLHVHVHRYPSKTSFLDAEVKLGYNFLRDGKDHFTPFGGVGFMNANMGVFKHAKFAYASTGFKYLHELNSVFGWGFNLKGFVGQQIAKKKDSKKLEAKKVGFGADMGIPLCFRFAKNRHWDITVEPYYLYLESNHEHASSVGSKLTLAHRF
ncbi:MAG: hypothetical protein QRY71_01930 [Candidatus Rhabdochlamydia sp.]